MFFLQNGDENFFIMVIPYGGRFWVLNMVVGEVFWRGRKRMMSLCGGQTLEKYVEDKVKIIGLINSLSGKWVMDKIFDFGRILG